MTTESNAQEKAEKAKGTPPVIRGVEKSADGWKESIVLWQSSGEAASDFNGFVMDGDTRVNVLGFINENSEKKTKFVSLRERTEGGLKDFCTGNPINSSKSGDPVYFDTIAFNIGDKAIFGRLTNAATEELQAELGFSQARVQRPSREECEGEVTDAAERPRG